MSEIRGIFARQILDSRGNPTLEVECYLESGDIGVFQVPSGASTGKYEALELRDKGKEFMGKGVERAIRNVNEIISKKLIGMDVLDQKSIDRTLIELDGTENKSKLGANAILGTSAACLKAAADFLSLPLYQYIGGIRARVLPVPLLNILNGGAHAPNNLSLQEFMIVPSGAESFRQALRWAVEVYYSLRGLLERRGLSALVGDEGGFAPDLNSNEEALDLIIEAIEYAGYKPGKEIFLALDSAANGFYKNGRYLLKPENLSLTSEQIVELYESWIKRYPIISIEDGLAEDDWEGWKILTQSLGDKIQIVGDDIFVTNLKRVEKGIKEEIANAVLIKPNQIGTITETLECIELSQRYGYATVISHRSGETEDTLIADLAVGTGSYQIKTGAPARGERVVKYNRLLKIEEEIEGLFSGVYAFKKNR